MDKKRILLVDDNDDVRAVFKEGLEIHGFDVTGACSVSEALRLISLETFDVLLSDLHMPDAGDGLTVVSAMRHTHPHAVTLVFSGYPAIQEAMTAILLQADEILVKPVSLKTIAEIIRKKLDNPEGRSTISKERVAAILERDTNVTIKDWLSRVERNAELRAIILDPGARTGHLPLLLSDLVRRLRLAPNLPAPSSRAACDHGNLRRRQGYTVAMVVEESRMLQVSIFNTLQMNLRTVDFSTVLLDVMTIADECDFQLKQAVLGFIGTEARSITSAATN